MKLPSKNIVSIILKSLIFVFAWVYVIFVLINEKRILEVDYSSVKSIHFSFLIFAILLMPINWFLESVKWRKLISVVQIVSFRESFFIVIKSLVYALVTPNRVGEIVSRASFLHSGNKVKGVALTVVGSISQFLVTLFFGTIALFFFVFTVEQDFSSIIIILLICIAICSFIYFYSSQILRFLSKWEWMQKIISNIELLWSIPRKLLVNVFVLSVLRYCVFVLQYAFCVILFDIVIPFEIILISIAVTYLFITIIPTIALAEFGIRGPVAIFVFGFFTSQLDLVFYATILIWVINIAVPSLVGSLFLFTQKKSDINK